MGNNSNTPNSSIANRWKQLSGEEHWNGLLEPLDIDLRRYIIHYGEMAQATMDAFNQEKASKFAGTCRYAEKDFFPKVYLENGNPFKYSVTKYIYATSNCKIAVPEDFIVKSSCKDAWCKESNWIGYVAVATDEGKKALGRRDIVVAWRGTFQTIEWIDDFRLFLVSAPKVFGNNNVDDDDDPKVHQGFYSIYTSENQESSYNKTSAQEQVRTEVKRLVEKYKNEETSITITGHSLGAALATLNAVDIATNGYNKPSDPSLKASPVVAIILGSPKVGEENFKKVFSSCKDLSLLRVRNELDIIPKCPIVLYSAVGEELEIDTRKSKYLKSSSDPFSKHNLEIYLHGVAGTQGSKGEFNLEVNRDIALVNKYMDALKDEYPVPASWKVVENKGMVQQLDGSWKLVDHEDDVVVPSLTLGVLVFAFLILVCVFSALLIFFKLWKVNTMDQSHGEL